VFAQVREKARQITCTSNCKQFELAILEYADDNDEGMPFAWNIQAQVGLKAAKDSGKAPAGMYLTIMPYVKSYEVFGCPDDKGLQVTVSGPAGANYVPILNLNGSKNTSGFSEKNGISAYDMFGMAYKFTKENFSFVGGQYGQKAFACTSSPATNCLVPATPGVPSVFVSGATPPPVPMTLSYFAQPSGTRMIRDFNAPADLESWAKGAWHPAGYNIGFADGHVKFVNKAAVQGKDFTCDGPTKSQNFDGSCNSAGLERI